MIFIRCLTTVDWEKIGVKKPITKYLKSFNFVNAQAYTV